MSSQTAIGAWRETTVWLVTSAVLLIWDSFCFGIEHAMFSYNILPSSGLMLGLLLLLPLLAIVLARTVFWRAKIGTDIRSAIFFAVILVFGMTYIVGHISALIFPSSGGIS